MGAGFLRPDESRREGVLMGWGTFWGWRTTVHTKKTKQYTKVIADEITRPRREAEEAAKAKQKREWKAGRQARTEQYAAAREAQKA
jgi:hypothetical protein